MSSLKSHMKFARDRLELNEKYYFLFVPFGAYIMLKIRSWSLQVVRASKDRQYYLGKCTMCTVRKKIALRLERSLTNTHTKYSHTHTHTRARARTQTHANIHAHARTLKSSSDTHAYTHAFPLHPYPPTNTHAQTHSLAISVSSA